MNISSSHNTTGPALNSFSNSTASGLWLSVLMPVYNGSRFLPAALESISQQEVSGLEIIALDDGSDDDSLEILHSYQKKMPLSIHSVPHTGNWVALTNQALRQAQGNYISLLHQDDYWLEGRVARLRGMTQQFPEVGFWLHPVRFVNPQGRFHGHWNCPLPVNTPLLYSQVWEHLLVQNFIGIAAPLFKRSLANQAGGMDESLWYTADWDYWLKLSALTTSYYLPESLAAFRVHPQSQTAVRSFDLPAFQLQLEMVLNRHLAQWKESAALRQKVEAAAHLSIRWNVALAGSWHGSHRELLQIFRSCLCARPSIVFRWMRDSRILERILPRLLSLS
jgi:glycosyltransferase involved in cell wall biosynthesis